MLVSANFCRKKTKIKELKGDTTIVENIREPFIITEKMIEQASSYIPLAIKKALANGVAGACLEAVNLTTENITGYMPKFYREDCSAKLLYLTYYFLTEYLGVKVPDEFSVEEYDYYASSHLFNQLERFKSGNQEIKNKVFDILYDYKEFKKMLDNEIFILKEGKNSTINRILASISVFSSPENLKSLNEILQTTMENIEIIREKFHDKNLTVTGN